MRFTALRRCWPPVAVAGLLALVAYAAAHSSLRFSRVEQPVDEVPALPEYPPDPAPSFPPSREVAPADPATVPDWLGVVAGIVCGLVVAAIVGLLLWTVARDLVNRTRRRAVVPRSGGPSPERATAEVVAVLDAGLVELTDTDADPRRAVIACWVRLEQAAAAAGVPRQVGDTPTDLVVRLLGLASARISADVLAAFAHVYREARYATHPVDERTRDEARSALARLRDELTTGVPA